MIPKLEKVMATHGLINELRTDNGPPFQSQELASYLSSLSVTHEKVTPRWPQASGEAERFMRTLNRVIRIAHARQESLELAIFPLIRVYCQTPHSTPGRALGQLSMGRVVADSILHHPLWQPDELDEGRVQARRQRRNDQASHLWGARLPDLKVGDVVLMQNRNASSKFHLPFEQEPWVIIHQKGTRLTAQRG